MFKVFQIPPYSKAVKRLKRKYYSLTSDLNKLIDQLEQNPTLGNAIGPNTYKVRLNITSKGKGKSGGGRVITYCITEEQEVWLLSIYDKAEQEDISDREVNRLVELANELSRELGTETP